MREQSGGTMENEFPPLQKAGRYIVTGQAGRFGPADRRGGHPGSK